MSLLKQSVGKTECIVQIDPASNWFKHSDKTKKFYLVNVHGNLEATEKDDGVFYNYTPSTKPRTTMEYSVGTFIEFPEHLKDIVSSSFAELAFACNTNRFNQPVPACDASSFTELAFACDANRFNQPVPSWEQIVPSEDCLDCDDDYSASNDYSDEIANCIINTMCKLDYEVLEEQDEQRRAEEEKQQLAEEEYVVLEKPECIIIDEDNFLVNSNGDLINLKDHLKTLNSKTNPISAYFASMISKMLPKPKQRDSDPFVC